MGPYRLKKYMYILITTYIKCINVNLIEVMITWSGPHELSKYNVYS